MVDAGLRARLTCVDPKSLDARFAGREFDAALLAELPPSVDPCGERGEFHTFAYDGPMFRSPGADPRGEVVTRDGFVFADLLPSRGRRMTAATSTAAPARRIVSLLASGTELVAALGLGERLVGRSHECDHPAWVKRLPALSRPAFDFHGTSAEIDARVRERLHAGLPLYEVDEARAGGARARHHHHPDPLRGLRRQPRRPGARRQRAKLERHQVVALATGTVDGILEGFARVAEVLGAAEAGRALVADIRARLAAVAALTRPLRRPRVACLEWIEPLFEMGNWGPEIVEIAGGQSLLSAPGAHSTTLPFEALRDADPEIIVVAPCGFDLTRTLAELPALTDRPGLARAGRRPRRARLRRRRQLLLQPLGADAVRHARDPRGDAAPRTFPAPARRDDLVPAPDGPSDRASDGVDTELTIRCWFRRPVRAMSDP